MMKPFTRRHLVARIAGILAIAAGLTTGIHVSVRADEPVRLTIFAAASLQNAIDDVNAAFAAKYPAVLKSSYASSSALAKQIEAGAQADIFISADLDWMKYIANRQLVAEGTEHNLLGNRLALVAKADDPVKIKLAPSVDLHQTLGDGRLAMGEVKSVPAGKYGKAALENLGIWDKVQDRVVAAANVRAALKLVSLGEAKMGIVYESDAKLDKSVRVVDTFPENSHPAIIYPAAVTKYAAGRQDGGADLAKAYADFLRSETATKIFAGYGFTPLK
ncbi:molybdate ABC transporter substrate-binding protein [Dongia soli]|uniref:Molybdate ABC transporter substrate-binding protein n=1 Tax=Dongia soli TaxID=600628 RepID=A0ABU5E789_9PROT|nr:molybdate ABC transporter substrate-binding protein [Dongia soli]MDY0881418.1 molybdate ABC transporter substrate-binding protein [Dongia soli]